MFTLRLVTRYVALALLEGESSMMVLGAGLPCFLAGVKSAKQDQSLAAHEFRRTYEKYAPPLIASS